MKVLGYFYWGIAILFGAVALFANSWTHSLNPGGTPVTDLLFEIVILAALIGAANECSKERQTRTLMQIQIVLAPIYLLIISVFVSLFVF